MIRLNGETYDVVLSLRGEQLVIRQTAPSMWRIAPPEISRAILSGLVVPLFRPVAPTAEHIPTRRFADWPQHRAIEAQPRSEP